MQPVRMGAEEEGIPSSIFLDLDQPGHAHEPVFCRASETVRGTTSFHGVQVLVQRPYSRGEDSEVSDSTDSKRHKWDWNSVIETPT